MSDLSFDGLSADAKSRNMISTIGPSKLTLHRAAKYMYPHDQNILHAGFAGIAGCFLAPKETYLPVATALTIAKVGWSVFCVQFLLAPGFFFAENFSKGPKDKFGILFMRMFGLVGFMFIYLSHVSDSRVAFPVWCAGNALMCFVGPQARRYI